MATATRTARLGGLRADAHAAVCPAAQVCCWMVFERMEGGPLSAWLHSRQSAPAASAEFRKLVTTRVRAVLDVAR